MPALERRPGFGVGGHSRRHNLGVLQGRADKAAGPGEQHQHPAAPVLQDPPVGHRVGDAPVKIGPSVHRVGPAGHGQAAGGLDGGVVVPRQVRAGKIPGLAGEGVGGHHHKGGRIGGEGVVIPGVLPLAAAENVIDIVQVHIGAGFHEVGKAHILLSGGVAHIEAVVAPPLSRQEGGQIGRSGGDAQTVFRGDVVVQ